MPLKNHETLEVQDGVTVYRGGHSDPFRAGDLVDLPQAHADELKQHETLLVAEAGTREKLRAAAVADAAKAAEPAAEDVAAAAAEASLH